MYEILATQMSPLMTNTSRNSFKQDQDYMEDVAIAPGRVPVMYKHLSGIPLAECSGMTAVGSSEPPRPR